MPTRKLPPTGQELLPGFYDEGFKDLDRNELEKALAIGLADEIAMLRISIRRVFESTAEPGETDTANQALGALGLAATRLAKLLQVDREISGGRDYPYNAINIALNQVIDEMRQEGKLKGWHSAG